MKMGKTMLAGATVLVAAAGLTAWATGAGRPVDETRLATRDAIAQSVDAPSAREKAFMASIARAEARAPKDGGLDVGDPDSFGKPVKWLGLMSTPFYVVAANCDGVDPSTVCLQTDAGSDGRVFRELDGLDEITLPGKSVENFLCHAQTPLINGTLANNMGLPNRRVFLGVYPVVTLSSPVLNAPGLVDPETGDPLNGRLKLYMPSVVSDQVLEPGARTLIRNASTRSCIGGFLTRASLMSQYGLTSAQVDQLYGGPMTLTLGATVYGNGVQVANVYVGYRFTGN